MPEINKPLLRLAAAIHAEIASHLGRDRLIQLPTSSWDSCVELTRQIRRAQLRGWHLAEHELLRDLGYTIPLVQSELAAILQELPHISEDDTVSNTADIYQDLLALGDEFDELDYDLRGHRLSVTTEPIELRGIHLGSFEIRLEWDRASRGSESAYRVIARNPHPAESDSNVTHPHVMSEHLCEGHSRVAIRQAISQGRLLDFFTLVDNGLRTYNDESPFVALEIWYGRNCSDCGALMDEDESYVCRTCNETICSGCECVCRGCEDSCCSECVNGCGVCDENYCRGCLHECKQCHANICLNCLPKMDVEAGDSLGKYLARQVLHYWIGTRVQSSMLRDFQNGGITSINVHDERCINCHENERKDGTEETSPATHGITIQPYGLGQTLVSA